MSRVRAEQALGGRPGEGVARYGDLRCGELLRALGGPGSGLAPAVRAARTLGLDMTRELARPPGGHPPVVEPGLETARLIDRALEAFDRAREAAGDELFVLVEFPHAILGPAMARHGAMEALSALGEAPADAAAILEESTRTCLAVAEAFADRPEIPLVLFMDDLAGSAGPFIAPETLRTLYFPRLRQVLDALAAGGTRALFHSDGDLNTLHRDIREAGAAGHHPVEPVGSWTLEAARDTGPDTILVGNGAVGKIAASPQAAAAEGRRCRAFARGHDAYFLAPAAEIEAGLPVENLLVFYGVEGEFAS